MPGILKIHSTFAREWLPGHSWLEYSPLDGIPRTYGTWGNNPTNKGNGLFENLELGKDSDACRSVIIDNVQELRLFQRIDHYRHMGNKAWTLLAPCSTFAADVRGYPGRYAASQEEQDRHARARTQEQKPNQQRRRIGAVF